jgi:hypothetical protein
MADINPRTLAARFGEACGTGRTDAAVGATLLLWRELDRHFRHEWRALIDEWTQIAGAIPHRYDVGYEAKLKAAKEADGGK